MIRISIIVTGLTLSKNLKFSEFLMPTQFDARILRKILLNSVAFTPNLPIERGLKDEKIS